MGDDSWAERVKAWGGMSEGARMTLFAILLLCIFGWAAHRTINEITHHLSEVRKMFGEAAAESNDHQRRNADATEKFVTAIERDTEAEKKHDEQVQHYMDKLSRTLELLERRGNGTP